MAPKAAEVAEEQRVMSLIDLRRSGRVRPFRRKFIYAVTKAMLIAKLRQKWSKLSTWQNVNNSFKNGSPEERQKWEVVSTARSLATHVLAAWRSREMFAHLERIKGKLEYKKKEKKSELPRAPDPEDPEEEEQ